MYSVTCTEPIFMKLILLKYFLFKKKKTSYMEIHENLRNGLLLILGHGRKDMTTT